MTHVTIRIAETSVAIGLSPAHLVATTMGHKEATNPGDRNKIETAITLVRRGHELRLVHRPQDRTQPATPDVKLIGLIAKAEAAHRALATADTIAANRKPHLLRLARLRYLAPDITAAILEGRQPVQLSARRLLHADTIPLSWKEQRRTEVSRERQHSMTSGAPSARFLVQGETVPRLLSEGSEISAAKRVAPRRGTVSYPRPRTIGSAKPREVGPFLKLGPSGRTRRETGNCVVPAVGLEPTTFRLQGGCSTS